MPLLLKLTQSLMPYLVRAVALLGCFPAMADSGIHFCFSPHPDDWQPFMNPKAYATAAAPPGHRVRGRLLLRRNHYVKKHKS